MSESSESGRKKRQLGGVVVGFILLLAVLYFLSRCSNQTRPLKPLRPTATPAAMVAVRGQPVPVGFTELNEDPAAVRDQRIRVSGFYTRLAAAECARPKGPNIRWALIADDLQLDALGFEQVLRLVAPGTSLTVEGIWRLYNGLAGCGKNVSQRQIWYLEVEQIVEPNPLFGSETAAGGPSLDIPPTSSTDGSVTNTPGPTPLENEPTVTATPATLEATPTLAAITGTPTSTATPEPAVGVTETPTAVGGTTVPTGTVTPTATPTDLAGPDGTSTVRPISTPTLPADTPAAETPTPPSVATATPGGYPGPGTPGPNITATSPYP